ncbi:hypothetical protein CEXT_190721 [Caerostris extrusa]|uniref:Uncharacterized protein n=1 Tax=Caerostris extrusa TaxID=172846 RepID=A0AAV4T1S6_CAEEX|nr:hypothetical protein CEXT_190721 [Caerostris extrusa]
MSKDVKHTVCAQQFGEFYCTEYSDLNNVMLLLPCDMDKRISDRGHWMLFYPRFPHWEVRRRSICDRGVSMDLPQHRIS